MKLVVNGKLIELPHSLSTLEDICSHYAFKPDTVIMELNGSLYKDKDFKTTLISENDRLEIVHFMGGGT